MQLWAFSGRDTGKNKSVTPIKITVGYSSPLPNICHYPLRPNGLAGISPSHKIT